MAYDRHAPHGEVRIEPVENGWVVSVHDGVLGSEGQRWVATSAEDLAKLVRQWGVNTLGETPAYRAPGAKGQA